MVRIFGGNAPGRKKSLGDEPSSARYRRTKCRSRFADGFDSSPLDTLFAVGIEPIQGILSERMAMAAHGN
jgi:hypothetical protein